MSFLVKHNLNVFILHVLEVVHQEWHQVLWQEKLSQVVGLGEVVLIIILNLLLHVVLEALWISVQNVLEDKIELHDVTTWGAEIRSWLIITVDIHQVGVEACHGLRPHDDVVVDFILELLKSLILGPLLSGFSTSLLSQLVLLDCLQFILFSLLDPSILGTNH